MGVGYLDAQIPSGALLPHFESLRVEGYVYKDSVPINMNPCIGIATIQAVCSEVISRNDKKSRGHREKLAEPLQEKAQGELGPLIVIVHLVSEEKIAADMLPESHGTTDSSTAHSQTTDSRVMTQSDSFCNEQAASAEVSTSQASVHNQATSDAKCPLCLRDFSAWSEGEKVLLAVFVRDGLLVSVLSLTR
jgi:hypothetical protein